jgi:hypothetical protein
VGEDRKGTTVSFTTNNELLLVRQSSPDLNRMVEVLKGKQKRFEETAVFE